MTPARTRLAKLLEMTGSPHDGEALNAARMAHNLVRGLKLTWEQAINGTNGTGNGVSIPYAPRALQRARQEGYYHGYAQGYRDGLNAPRTRPASWQAIARDMLEKHADGLTEWETGFLQSWVKGRWHTPTTRQRHVLERIADRLGIDPPG